MSQDRDCIAAYIEGRAAKHEKRSKRRGVDAEFHGNLAVNFKALATDIRACLDQPDEPNPADQVAR